MKNEMTEIHFELVEGGTPELEMHGSSKGLGSAGPLIVGQIIGMRNDDVDRYCDFIKEQIKKHDFTNEKWREHDWQNDARS